MKMRETIELSFGVGPDIYVLDGGPYAAREVEFRKYSVF